VIRTIPHADILTPVSGEAEISPFNFLHVRNWLHLVPELVIISGRSSYQWMTRMTDKKKCRYVCLECHYIYDPEKGDPSQNIPPGTPFEDLADMWRCPECKIFKIKHGVFKKMDE
jgi:rubredoxin